MSSNKRILIVEDEGIVAADLEEHLIRLGYAVAGKAASGENALEQVESSKPDLVLMDIILQGQMDGVQAATRITEFHEIPVVFLTAHADDPTMRRAQVSGPFGYILKPFDERELHVAIEIALYRHQVETELRDLNHELQEAIDQIKTLRGLLPICAWCKDVREDDGYWKKIEDYIHEHSQAELTHSICPKCAAKFDLGFKR